MPGKVIAAGIALAAGLALTACGSGGGSAASAGPSRPPTASAGSGAGPVACAASDIATAGAALRRAGTAARSLEHYPIPACADPKGYWRAVLLRIEAAADSAGTSDGQGTLTIAQGVMKQM